VTTQKGQRISAAKKGKPLVARGPNEITRQQAVRETGLSAKVLLEGADRQLPCERGEDVRPGLRHRRLPHANGGEVILFDSDELVEDLARLPCQWCDLPAPGDSGRCRRHQAKKYATVELVCEWKDCPRNGEPFTRYGSWLREREGRGRFCSDRCEMLWLKANDPRFASPHAPFDADSAHERYERLAPQFDEARAELALPLTVEHVAAGTHTSTAVIRTHAPECGGRVIEIDGKRELAFPADAAERYPKVWAGRAHVTDEHWTKHRARYLDQDFMVGLQGRVGQQARTITLLRERGFTQEEAEAIVRTRTTRRRRRFLAHRAGAPKKNELRAQLGAIACEVIGQYRDLGHLSDLSETSLLAEIGLLAWQYDLGDFRARYPAGRGARDDPESPAPGWRKAIVDRVRGLIGPDTKALLIATE
jgi:hypothetical protein